MVAADPEERPASAASEPAAETAGKKRPSSDSAKAPAGKKQKKDAAAVAAPPKAPLLVVFGLGNVGADYNKQRHNVGGRVVETLALKSQVEVVELAALAESASALKVWKVASKERPQLLLPPLVAINDSGPALKLALEKLGHGDAANAACLLVISDDCSLPLGTIRLKQKGSSGGHNGLKSVEAVYGASYHRLKVGIGGKPTKEHVVGEFASGTETETIEAVIQRAADAVKLWMELGPEAVLQVMQKVNSPEFCKVAAAAAETPAAPAAA
eukprot:TRINITY_DN20656_c0_g1_i1.p1 TRINITY_DN20656_c0_g1~~TRINITY_DN20656_c0_g1_i1.p1  ORF type:complete len:270 (-),score=93.47 TRINITY_DN20656_c0_g1_i1:329-1138(-)